MVKTKQKALIELQAFLKAFGVITESDVTWHRVRETNVIEVSGLRTPEIVAAYHAFQQAIYLAPWFGERGNLCVTILGEGEL